MAESQSERTENPYATYGPGDTDESWAEYFRRVRHGGNNVGVEHHTGDEGSPGDVDEHRPDLRTELDRGRELGGLENPPDPLLAYEKLLIKHGFQTATGWSVAHYEGRIYGPTAQKAGEKAPDRTITYAWVSGYREDRGLVKIRYERVNDRSWTCDFRQLNKEYRPVSDKEMKAWIKNEHTETE